MGYEPFDTKIALNNARSKNDNVYLPFQPSQRLVNKEEIIEYSRSNVAGLLEETNKITKPQVYVVREHRRDKMESVRTFQ